MQEMQEQLSCHVGDGHSPWQACQRRSGARQTLPEGAYGRSHSHRCTSLTGRHMPAKVRLDSGIGCKPEWSLN